MSCQTPVVVALDFEQQASALNLVSQLDPSLMSFKSGQGDVYSLWPSICHHIATTRF